MPSASSAGVNREGCTFGIDCDPYHHHAAIVAADGKGNIEVVEAGLPTGELVARVTHLATQYSGYVVLQGRGPARQYADEIRRTVKVYEYDDAQFADACARFFRAVADKKVHVLRHPALTAAVLAATSKPAGDNWRWARDKTETDITTLIAATLAHDRATRPNTVWVST